MEELATQLGRYGLLLIFMSVLLEQAGLPIPASPVLVLAGALAARGELSAPLILLTAVVASLVADAAWYVLGRRQGRRMLSAFCRISLNPESCVRQTERMFDRYGVYSIALSKLVPGLSTVAPPLAGTMGVGPFKFAVAATLGAILWAGGAIAIGWVFHGSIEQVADWLESLGLWGLVLLGTLLLCFIAFKWWQRRRFYHRLRMARITPEELRRLLEEPAGLMVFDVRTDGGRRMDPRRIPGALVLHTDNPDEVEAILSTVPRDRDIVLYCT